MSKIKGVCLYKEGDYVCAYKGSFSNIKKSFSMAKVDFKSLPEIIMLKVVGSRFIYNIDKSKVDTLVSCILHVNDKNLEVLVNEADLFPSSMRSAVEGFIYYMDSLEQSQGYFGSKKRRRSSYILSHINSLVAFKNPVAEYSIDGILTSLEIKSDMLPKEYKYFTDYKDGVVLPVVICSGNIEEDLSLSNLIYTVNVPTEEGTLVLLLHDINSVLEVKEMFVIKG